MSDSAREAAGGSAPAQGVTNPQETARLYDRLRAAARANDRIAVEEACRALVQAGRPLSEILIHAGLGPHALQGLEARDVRPSPYHWGSQWSIRPDLPQQIPNTDDSAKPHRLVTSDVPFPEPRAAALPISVPEISPAAHRDLIEEWQARQQVAVKLPDPSPSNTHTEQANDSDQSKAPDLPSKTPDTAEVIREAREGSFATSAKDPGLWYPSKSMLLPIAGVCASTVAVVSLGLYLLAGGGETKLGSGVTPEMARDRTTSIEARRPIEDPQQPSTSADMPVTAETSLPTQTVASAPVNEPADTAPASRRTSSAKLATRLTPKVGILEEGPTGLAAARDAGPGEHGRTCARRQLGKDSPVSRSQAW